MPNIIFIKYIFYRGCRIYLLIRAKILTMGLIFFSVSSGETIMVEINLEHNNRFLYSNGTWAF